MNNRYIAVIIILLVAILVLQVYHVVDQSRPILRPSKVAPTRTPPALWFLPHDDLGFIIQNLDAT
jgi:hypothetical protein